MTRRVVVTSPVARLIRGCDHRPGPAARMVVFTCRTPSGRAGLFFKPPFFLGLCGRAFLPLFPARLLSARPGLAARLCFFSCRTTARRGGSFLKPTFVLGRVRGGFGSLWGGRVPNSGAGLYARPGAFYW